MAWEARPEGALDRWCVVEESEQRVRIIADDLSEAEAHVIASAHDTAEALEALVNRLHDEDGIEGFDADALVGPELKEAWMVVLRARGVVA